MNKIQLNWINTLGLYCMRRAIIHKIFRRKKMLDIKRIRENLDDIKKAMDRRGEKEFDLDAVVALDDERR